MFLMAAMGPPGGGRNVISRRLQSRFNLINMTFPQESQIKRIFGTMIAQKLQDFDEEVKPLGDMMTKVGVVAGWGHCSVCVCVWWQGGATAQCVCVCGGRVGPLLSVCVGVVAGWGHCSVCVCVCVMAGWGHYSVCVTSPVWCQCCSALPAGHSGGVQHRLHEHAPHTNKDSLPLQPQGHIKGDLCGGIGSV